MKSVKQRDGFFSLVYYSIHVNLWSIFLENELLIMRDLIYSIPVIWHAAGTIVRNAVIEKKKISELTHSGRLQKIKKIKNALV